MGPAGSLAAGLAGAAVAGLIAVAPAGASVTQGQEALSERALRQLEERTLGAEHAREHALARRSARRETARLRRLSPAARRRVLRPAARASAAGDPATEGVWRAPFTMPVVGVHTALLPTGKVMLFSQRVNDYRGDAAGAFLWDPAKGPGSPGEFKAVPPPANIWCGAQSLMADGQLLVTGGNLAYESATSGWKGLKTVFTFDPWSETWTRQPDMPKGRWYPTQTLLPDGRTLITSGYTDTGGKNNDIDVFNPPATRGGRGSITTVARYGALANSPGTPRLYPHWFVMPSGGVLNTGYTQTESWLLRFGAGGAAIGEDRPDWRQNRKYGSAVLVPGTPAGSTRIMRLGGYDSLSAQKASVASSEIYDEATPGRAPVPGPSMRTARSHQNTVLLPDGSMVNVGGGHGEQPGLAAAANANQALGAAGPEHRALEILDPGASQWRTGPSQAYKRAYHSTAILLPDGRVLSAGDDRDVARGGDYNERDRAEIYEPAYLHRPGPRPSITGAPGGVGFGERFSIQTSTPIGSAVLVAPGATTHANDMHQRVVPLTAAPRPGGGADLVAPPTANVAPPGYYMLFARSPDGKPSVARWVYVGQSRPGAQFQGDSQSSPPAAPNAPPPVTQPVAPPAAAPADRTAPRVTMRTPSTLRRMRSSRRLQLRVRLDEPGRVTFSAELRTRRGRVIGRVPGRGTSTLRFTRSATRMVSLPLSRAIRRRLPSSYALVVARVRARDAAGNTASRTIRLTLTRR